MGGKAKLATDTRRNRCGRCGQDNATKVVRRVSPRVTNKGTLGWRSRLVRTPHTCDHLEGRQA